MPDHKKLISKTVEWVRNMAQTGEFTIAREEQREEDTFFELTSAYGKTLVMCHDPSVPVTRCYNALYQMYYPNKGKTEDPCRELAFYRIKHHLDDSVASLLVFVNLQVEADDVLDILLADLKYRNIRFVFVTENTYESALAQIRRIVSGDC